MTLRIVALSCFFVAVAGPRAARADDTPAEVCIRTFDEAQSEREEGRLISATRALQQCAAPSCPKAIAGRCIGWLEEVKGATPSVVIAAKGPDGNDVVAVTVREGDRIIIDALDGLAVNLDPGPHQLVFTFQGTELERRVVLVEGEKNKRIEVVFEEKPVAVPGPSPNPLPPPRPSSPVAETEGSGITPWVWVSFGIGGAGFVVGAVTGGLALSKKRDLDEQCVSTGCTQGDIDEGMTLAHTSTAGFAVGGAGVAVGTMLLLLTMGGESGAEKAAQQLLPWAGPGVLGVQGYF